MGQGPGPAGMSCIWTGAKTAGVSALLQEGFPNLLLPIYIKNIHKCKQ
jgi:hypothetical protein